jgi:hypothetical protein
VPRTWLKSFGDSRQPIRSDWVNEFLRDPTKPLELMTGPSARSSMPAMRPGDRFVLHAVGHGNVFAEGEIESGPEWDPDRKTKWDPTRWPWTYCCRVDLWVPRVTGGPHTWDYVARVKGQIQRGSPYVELTDTEHETLVTALGAARTAIRSERAR